MSVISALSLNLPTTLIVIALLNLHFLTFCCLDLNQNQPSQTLQGLLVEEKTRLGSTPPSCYNKCNNCHPCMAVQVPTMPNHAKVVEPKKPMDYFDTGNRYSNYKPLGWKCICNGHLYNP